MPYLVDGNNVMAQIRGWHKDRGKARRRMIRDLVRFVAANRAKVTVVFDGTGDADFPDGIVYKSVRVLYAKPGSDADSRIKEMVGRASYRRDLIVVTSDKPLGSFVAHKGAKVMRSGDFRRLLSESEDKLVEAAKRGDTSPVDVDDWMGYFEKSDK
jgi:predicted RNA-binding protein with PIN domain